MGDAVGRNARRRGRAAHAAGSRPAVTPRETDELIVEEVLDQVRTTWWQFIFAGDRRTRAPHVERVLRERLAAARTHSLKGADFAALRSVTLTPEGVEWLTSIWDGRASIPGLPLEEPDYIALSRELALRAGDGWKGIVAKQIARTKDPDRRAQLTFVMPALSSDAAERDRFFESLRDAANRRHEPWVLDGLRALHHPLRGRQPEKYVLPGLQLLQEIQRTGDIFFPKRWMDMTLSGEPSPAAAGVVRAFVAGLPPGYPDRLRRIVLSSADLLFRSARTK